MCVGHKQRLEMYLHSWPCPLAFLPSPLKRHTPADPLAPRGGQTWGTGLNQPHSLKQSPVSPTKVSRPCARPHTRVNCWMPLRILCCLLAAVANYTRPCAVFLGIRRTKTRLLCLVREHYLLVFLRAYSSKINLKIKILRLFFQSVTPLHILLTFTNPR